MVVLEVEKSPIVAAIFGLLRVLSGNIIMDDLGIKSSEPKALRFAIMLVTHFVPGMICQKHLLHDARPVPDSIIMSALGKTKLLEPIVSSQAFLTIYNVRLSRTTKTPIIEIKYAAVAMKNGRPIHAAPL